MAKKKKEVSSDDSTIEIENTTKESNLENFDEEASKSSVVDEDKKQKEKKDKANYEKVSFLRRMRTSIILFFLGIFTGCGVGVWYYNNILRVNVDYESLFEEAYKYDADYSEIFNRNFGIASEDDYENWKIVADTNGITPASLSPADNFALAEWNANHASTFAVVGHGKVLTLGISQGIYSARKYDGTSYAFESISSGVVSVVSTSVHKKGTNEIKMYNGSNVQGDTATWKYDSSLTYDQYIDAVGNTPYVVQPYIVSYKTITSSSEVTFDEENETYSFTLVLDNVLSVIRYARQVKKTGGLGSYPEFSKITQTITIDKNWNLVSIDVKEEYSAVAFGMKVGCSGSLLSMFSFNGDVEMPV